MFENYKLNKYMDKIVGFAYQQGDKINLYYYIYTYLVVNINEEIKFIPYIKYKKASIYGVEIIIDQLEKNGYKSINYYIDEKTKLQKRKQLY